MAENKKSYIGYVDWGDTFDMLTDEQSGKLIKHFYAYLRDENPVLDDPILKIAFHPIMLQLKRDLKVWENKRESRSEAGKKGMEKRWNKNNQITKDNNVIDVITPVTKITVTDTVNDNVNVNVNANVIKEEEPKRFSPPTLPQVINLMAEKLDDFTAQGEAQKFIAYYESNGWRVGKNKMKKWEAAAAGWVSRINNYKISDNGKKFKGASKDSAEPGTILTPC